MNFVRNPWNNSQDYSWSNILQQLLEVFLKKHNLPQRLAFRNIWETQNDHTITNSSIAFELHSKAIMLMQRKHGKWNQRRKKNNRLFSGKRRLRRRLCRRGMTLLLCSNMMFRCAASREISLPSDDNETRGKRCWHGCNCSNYERFFSSARGESVRRHYERCLFIHKQNWPTDDGLVILSNSCWSAVWLIRRTITPPPGKSHAQSKQKPNWLR